MGLINLEPGSILSDSLETFDFAGDAIPFYITIRVESIYMFKESFGKEFSVTHRPEDNFSFWDLRHFLK